MPITGQDSTKIAEYADNAVWTAPLGTALPTGPFPVAYPAGWTIFGHLSSEGITEARSTQNQQEYSSTGDFVYESWSQLRESYTVICDEQNPVVLNLRDPNAVRTIATPGVSEVQSLAVTGTPTGGTILLAYNGQSTSVPYNASASAIQTALRSIGATAVNVTGTGPYTITFPATSGDVPGVTADGSALTGGTSPAAAVTTTTPGVTPVYQWVKNSAGVTTPPLRLFSVEAVKLATPAWSERGLFVGRANATDMGAITKGQLKKTTFEIVKYTDPTLGVETILSTNPSRAVNSFA